jgi:hypothetical protein
MNRWIVVGAIGLVGILLELLRGKRRLGPPQTIRATIGVGGTPGHGKVTRAPEDLVARKRDTIVWDIEFDKGAEGVVVWTKNFILHKTKSNNDPFEGDEKNRKNHPHPREIRDKIKNNADTGCYKYDIQLDDTLALDPEIMIKDI